MEHESFMLLLKILAVITLVLLNGFFVAAEFSFVKLRDTQLEPLIIKGHKRAIIARRIANNLESCISATQLGITFCGMGLGVLVSPLYKSLLAPVFTILNVESPTVRDTTAIIFGFIVSTIVLIVIGELVPKAIAIRKTLSTTLHVAKPLEWFYRLTFPLIWTLNHLAGYFLAQLGIQPVVGGEHSHSDEELRLLVSSAQRQAGATKLGRDIVLNAMDLSRRVVREVMRPRQEIMVLNTQDTIAACLDVAEKTRYSRFPLCENGEIDCCLGVVHVKDLYAWRIKASTGNDLKVVAKKIIYLPPSARVEKLLQMLLERKLHMAIVVDEYGGTMGMVTLENLLEELVGQIQDEFDQEKPLLLKTGDNTWEVDGACPLHELAELVHEPLSGEGITTASGWLTHRAGGFPKDNDVVTLSSFELKVIEMDGLRVAKLMARQIATPGQPLADTRTAPVPPPTG